MKMVLCLQEFFLTVLSHYPRRKNLIQYFMHALLLLQNALHHQQRKSVEYQYYKLVVLSGIL